MSIEVLGAGHAGLIAAAMLRSSVSAVFEAGPGLPNATPAVMRFRSPALAHATGIQLKRVRVAMAVQPRGGDSCLKAALLYSRRCTGRYDPTGRSIGRLLPGLKVAERYVHVGSLARQLADRVTAPRHYNRRWSHPLGASYRPSGDEGWWPPSAQRRDQPLISTVPMPVLAGLLAYDWPPGVEFAQQPGWYLAWPSGLKGVYATLYTPYDADFTRISITDGYITAEVYDPARREVLAGDPALEAAIQRVHGYLDPGVLAHPRAVEFHEQAPGKISPVDEAARRAFIRYATREFGIYSLGRYATWRPGLLLDDVVHDVRVIQGLISGAGHQLIDRYTGADR